MPLPGATTDNKNLLVAAIDNPMKGEKGGEKRAEQKIRTWRVMIQVSASDVFK